MAASLRRQACVLLLPLLTLISNYCWANHATLTPFRVGVTTIEAEQLVKLIRSNPELRLIDARIGSGHDKGHIEGSIHLIDIDTNCDSLARIITNKSNAVVFYCGSYQCGRSLNSIRIAKSCGYTNLYWFRGGFDEWKEKGYPYIKGSD